MLVLALILSLSFFRSLNNICVSVHMRTDSPVRRTSTRNGTKTDVKGAEGPLVRRPEDRERRNVKSERSARPVGQATESAGAAAEEEAGSRDNPRIKSPTGDCAKEDTAMCLPVTAEEPGLGA